MGFTTLGGFFIGAALYSLTWLPYQTPSVRFESIESKTPENHPVFNQVRLSVSRKQDVWFMRQSHTGVKLETAKWDELMIKVDKSKRPYAVTYHQLLKGRETEYRVSCYFCHSNGPRAIRASGES